MPGPPQPCCFSPTPGKTSLAYQFVEGKFVECYEPTVEITYNKMVVVGTSPSPCPQHVGKKADLALQSREVRMDEGKKLAESWEAFFLESLAKVIRGFFMKIIEEIERVDNSYGRSTGCCLM